MAMGSVISLNGLGSAPLLDASEPLGRAQSFPVPDLPLSTQLSQIGQRHASEHQASFQQLLRSSSRASDHALRAGGDEPVIVEHGDMVDRIGASELNDSLIEVNAGAAASEPAFSVDDALDFRVNHFQSALSLADELMHQVGLAMEHTRDPAALRKLGTVLEGLERFKQDVKSAEDNDRKRADRLRQDEQVAANARDRFRLAKELLGGAIKKPFGAKAWYKFQLLDGLRAKFQQAGLRRAGARGEALRLPGSPLHLRTALATHLAGLMKAGGLEGYSATALQKSLILHSAQHVERAMPWRTIDNAITLTGSDGRTHAFANRQEPAREFNADLAAGYGDRRGVSCMNSVEPKHVVNLWKTSFSAQDSSGLTFSALRHGIHDAYSLKGDPAARTAAADARVHEFLRTAAQTYPERLIPAGSDHDGRPVFELPVVSISLVSPARFGDERAMWLHQRDAYARANQAGPITVTLDTGDGQGPRDVWLKPAVVAFNTPVNTFALESGSLMRSALGGWAESDAANGPALETLIGSANAGGLAERKLLALRAERDVLSAVDAGQRTETQRTRLAVLEGRIPLAETLIAQIRTIVSAPTDTALSHHRAGTEPYKLPVRLAALANELELPVAFNCKSGKDRTGQLDVEVKALYASIALEGGRVPEPERERSANDRANHLRLFNEAGSFEIQKHNTTMPGSKINVEAAKAQLKQAMREALPAELSSQAGRHVIKEHIKGLSGWVGS